MTAEMIVLCLIATIIGMAMLIRTGIRHRTEIRDDMLPPEVKRHSNEVKSESNKLRKSLNDITESPDPIRSLVRAMTGDDDDVKHR